MTEVIRAKLKERGFLVADSEEGARSATSVTGVFGIKGAGKERISGSLGDLLEKAIPVDPSGKPDYHHQNVDLCKLRP